jgi:glycosyltransferase involved in cell wall biosynthesis
MSANQEDQKLAIAQRSDRKGRVVLWTDSDEFAGTERHIADLEKGMRQLGYDVVVGCQEHSPLHDLVRVQGGALEPLNSRGWRALGAVLTIKKWLSAGRVQILHAHNGRTAILGALACALAGRGSLMVTQHFIHPARTRRKRLLGTLSHWAHRWLAQRVNVWVAVSEAVHHGMVERDDSGGRHVFVVHHGIDGTGWLSLDERANRMPLSGKKTGVPSLVCVARLTEEKGHLTLLRSVLRLKKEGVPFHLHLVGDGALREALERFIRGHDLAGQVSLWGRQDHPERWMEASDVLVLASPQEPFGLVLLEGMRAGKPVIAASAGGVPEIVVHGRTGLLFRPDDDGDLADKMKELLENEDLQRRFGVAGWERWRAVFSLESMSRRMAGLYDRLLSGEGGTNCSQ